MPHFHNGSYCLYGRNSYLLPDILPYEGTDFTVSAACLLFAKSTACHRRNLSATTTKSCKPSFLFGSIKRLGLIAQSVLRSKAH